MSSVLFSTKNYCGIDVKVDKEKFFFKISKEELKYIPDKIKKSSKKEESDERVLMIYKEDNIFVHPHLWTMIQAKSNTDNFFKVMEYLEPSASVEESSEESLEESSEEDEESCSETGSSKSFGCHSSDCSCTLCDFDKVYKRVKRKLENRKSCKCIEYTLEDLNEILSRIKLIIFNLGLPEFTDSVNTDPVVGRDSDCDCHEEISRTIKLIFACMDHVRSNFIYLGSKVNLRP